MITLLEKLGKKWKNGRLRIESWESKDVGIVGVVGIVEVVGIVSLWHIPKGFTRGKL